MNVVEIFREVRQVQDAINAYCLAPDKVPVSLDDLTDAIREAYEVAVVFFLVPLKTPIWRGHIEIWPLPNETNVYINSDLNRADSRFAAAKELLHVIIANASNLTENPVDLIRELVVDIFVPSNGEHSEAFEAEMIAMFVAIELLFPYSLRDAARKEIEDGKSTIYKTAEWLEIPEHTVELALSDRYTRFSSRTWGEVLK